MSHSCIYRDISLYQCFAPQLLIQSIAIDLVLKINVMGGVASRTARGRGSSLNFRKKAPSKTLESRSTSNPEHGHQTPSLAANTMADREGSIERQRIGSTNPDLPDGEMLHELFGMITSKTKRFVEAEEV